MFADSSILFCPTTHPKLSSWLLSACQLLNHPSLSTCDCCSLTHCPFEKQVQRFPLPCHFDSVTLLDSLLASTSPLNQANHCSSISSTSRIIPNPTNISFTFIIWNYPLMCFFLSPCCTHLPLAPYVSRLTGNTRIPSHRFFFPG